MKNIAYIASFIFLSCTGLMAIPNDGFDVFDNDEKQAKEFQISVYPNPANDRVNVVVEPGSEISFYDLVGQEVEVTTLSHIDREKETAYTYDLQHLPKGLYFIKVKNLESKSHHLVKFKKL